MLSLGSCFEPQPRSSLVGKVIFSVAEEGGIPEVQPIAGSGLGAPASATPSSSGIPSARVAPAHSGDCTILLPSA